ncbi:hypothetical protein [Polynucleobacter sp. JS-JIR-5-A7]|uniref:hypothetical protein n=1 Tax=Polynucleobacter sp. JS-JIR-5-A7 TaxID=1758395 RepID=UPI001BFE04D0|nr:hypothetical protein [Polynucleobacter sp. JS-JIR-5-A7]QWE05633.1 hypothetical protein AOC29_05720 [Polynucleobacter sp. JS-JIR-5-A7]
MQMITQNNLIALSNLNDYRRAGREHIFPSEASLLWFIRKNKIVLAKAGAILKPAGRLMINQDKFDNAVLNIGILDNHLVEN